MLKTARCDLFPTKRVVMSNSAVVSSLSLECTNSNQGQTYESIIEETVRASQQDFIEAGISLDYLEALRTVSEPHAP